MNETADHLLAVLSTAEPLLRNLSPALAALKPHPEKWSPKQIIGHLIDSASNNQHKFVRTMAAPKLDFVAYAQDFWVDAQHYQDEDWNNLIDLWLTYNRHLAHVIRHVDPSVLQHAISIQGSVPFTLQFIMADYVEHLKHHLLQIFPGGPFSSKFANVYNA